MNNFGYHTDIESAFIQRRGQSLFLSPKDWQLMSDWKNRNVPLHCVLTAIDEVFIDRQGKGKISSLAYITNAVESKYQQWMDGRTGAAVEAEPQQFNCKRCCDLGEIDRKPENAEFDWQLEWIPCPDCQ